MRQRVSKNEPSHCLLILLKTRLQEISGVGQWTRAVGWLEELFPQGGHWGAVHKQYYTGPWGDKAGTGGHLVWSLSLLLDHTILLWHWVQQGQPQQHRQERCHTVGTGSTCRSKRQEGRSWQTSNGDSGPDPAAPSSGEVQIWKGRLCRGLTDDEKIHRHLEWLQVGPTYT